MRRTVVVMAAVAGLAHAGPARAEVPAGYVSVDEVNVGAGFVSVIGLAAGGATPVTQTFTVNANTTEERAVALDSCHRALLLALAKPGQYAAQLFGGTCRVRLVAP